MAAERLQKYLARAGVASRRHAEELITEGRVTVNNQKVTELGSKVGPGDLVTVDGKLVSPPEESSYYLLYKPVGVVTTLSDPQGRPTVANYIEETGKRLFPVGRLDYDAEGALLVTNDGELAHKLTHPSFQVPRTYLAKVKGTPDAATLDKLRGGVRLEDGMATPLSVDVFEQAERNTWLKLVVAEGRPHLIKRLCAAVGSPVVRLYRPSYAGITVEGLRPGELRPLTPNQVRLLQEVADGKATPAERELKLPPRRHGRSAPGFEADVEDADFSEEAPAPTRAARKPARATRTERPERRTSTVERPERRTSTAERPARAGGRPERKVGAPRGEGGARPAFRGTAGGRVERRTWTPREEAREEGPERQERAPRGEARGERSARPERQERAPRGEARGGRPERREWAPRGEERGARPERRERKPFGSEEGATRRAPARGDRPERREWAPRSEGRGERSARPERKAWAPRGEERGERSARPERKEWAPRGEERGERSARPERRERKPFGSEEGATRRAPARGDRPERREWAPRSEERGARPGPRSVGDRPARKTWSPAGGGAERPVRRGAARPGGEEAGEGSRPFVNWRAKKHPEPKPEWNTRPSRGAGAPRGRGPRKGR